MEGRSRNGQIGILGPVELLGDGPVPLGGVKERCLLAALAVHCGEAVPPFRPFAEAIAGYGELVSPQQLRADLGLAGPALARIAPRLGELLPDLTPPSALQPDEEQFRLLDAAAQFFTAVSARAPVLLVLDDLQWADAGTAMMLRQVARSCGHRGLLLAGAYRTTELTAHNVLGDVLGAMQAETECTVIRLRALGAEAIGQLVAAEVGLQPGPAGCVRRGCRRARGRGPGPGRRSARDGRRVPGHRRRPGRT